MNPYDAVRGVEGLHTRTLTVPDREPVERIEWLDEECCAAWVSWMRGYPGAHGVGEAACRAEAAERWITHCLGRHSDGSGVWTDEAGADRAAWREVAERVAVVDWWLNHRSLAPLDEGLYRLPCLYEGYFAVLAWSTEDGLRPCFATAGGLSLGEAVEKARCELALTRHWHREHPTGLYEYGCAESAPWLYAPVLPTVPLEGSLPMPRIARRVRFRHLHYAAVEMPDEVTIHALRREARYPN